MSYLVGRYLYEFTLEWNNGIIFLYCSFKKKKNNTILETF